MYLSHVSGDFPIYIREISISKYLSVSFLSVKILLANFSTSKISISKFSISKIPTQGISISDALL